MSTLLKPKTGKVLTQSGALLAIGAAANRAAEMASFRLYQDRRPENTQRAQRAALTVFAEFMRTCGLASSDLYSDPLSWLGVTWGLVQAFQQWLLKKGYSVKTINDRVSTVKVYMTLANQAGVVPDSEILRLQSLRGFTRKEAVDTDAKREKQGMAIRIGTKKSAAVVITEEQARSLCRIRTNTPQSRRDALLMCLFLDHGMRVSEVSILKVDDLDIQAKQMIFYRPKTGKTSRHNLRGRAWQCLIEYLNKDQSMPSGYLLMPSSKSGALIRGRGMTTRAICERVMQLGQAIGIENLSPHDCRHYGATRAGNDPNVSLAALMAWGGWDSPQSAARYINRGHADNDGVSLGMD